MWTFRLRIRLDPSSRLQINANELQLELPRVGPVVLVAWLKSKPISEAEWLLFKGGGETEAIAWSRGTMLSDLLRSTFSRLGIAAEMGLAPSWRLTDVGRALIAERTGAPILDDVHGLMVYRADPSARFFSGGDARMSVGHAAWRFEQTLTQAAARPSVGLNYRQRMAFDQFSRHRFEASPAARLLSLTAAVETLLVPRKRTKPASRVVERLIKLTRGQKSLGPRDRDALVSSLTWLRYESITTSGAVVMEQALPGRLYGNTNLSAATVWKKAYALRSALTHGRSTKRSQIDVLGGLMFQVVGDLLAGDLLAFEPAAPTGPGLLVQR
jgi:hypothetical protein